MAMRNSLLPTLFDDRVHFRLPVDPKRVAIALGSIVVVLLALHLAVSLYNHQVNYTLPQHLTRVMGVDVENSIPTWYSSMLLFVCCGLLSAIAFLKKRTRDRYTRHWQGLAVLFLLMSLDEAASLHETLDRALKVWLNLNGWLYYAWVIPGMIFVGCVGLAYWKFLKALPPATRQLFIIAGVVYVGGAIGIEIIGGSYAEVYGRYTLRYSLITTLEEALEMAGVVWFVYALLNYLQQTIQGLIAPLRPQEANATVLSDSY